MQLEMSLPPRVQAATIPELLRQAARLYGAAPAIAAQVQRSISYERLYQFLRESRYRLLAAGIAPGRRMALAMPAGAEAITLNLLAMSTGIALPMNPALPREAVLAQMKKLQPAVVIANFDALPVYRDVAVELGLPFVGIHTVEGAPAGQFRIGTGELSTERVDGSVSPPFLPFSTAAVLQTSGSGEPRRVPLTHANLLAGAAAIERTLELTEADRFLNIAPHFRVVGLALVLAALKAGNTIQCTPGYVRAEFLDWAAAFQPTWFWAAPSMLRELLPLARVRGEKPCGKALRLIRTGSAALGAEWLEPLETAFGVPVLENYGMTEASAQIASNSLDAAARQPGSVGKAAGPEILILAANGEPAPAGVEGEILVRGANVTSGYESDDGEAKPSIKTPEAFWQGLGSRWLRTGDLGRLDADGHLYVAARIKEIINRAGEKVCPVEVEAALASHPSVEQAVAFPVTHPWLGEDVGAAVVLRAGLQLSEAELVAYASERLAAYEVPSRIAFVPSIRAGSGGKMDRSQMAARLGMNAAAASGLGAGEPMPLPYTPPGTALEKELAELWRVTLQVSRVGLHDSFFELGGDQAAIDTLSQALHQRFGVMRRLLDRADFFAHPTLRAQALMIAQAQRDQREFKTFTVEMETIPENVVSLNARPRRREDAPPLFLVPMAGTAPDYMQGFARHLIAEQRCFGLAQRLPGESESLEQYAAALITGLEAAVPEGPFYLGGHCFGGVLAYEMAQQLAARGRAPQTLYLFDVPTPANAATGAGPGSSMVSRYVEYATAAWRHWKHIKGTDADHTTGAEQGDAHVHLLRSYQLKSYKGSAIVFVSRDHAKTDTALNRRLGWCNLIQPPPEIVMADGSHLDLFREPAVVELAAVCRQRLPRRQMESVLALAESVPTPAKQEKLTRVGVTP